MQYLIRTLTDSTGHPFTHVTQARENETFTVIEAESKEEALKYNEVSGDKNNLSVEEMKKRLRKDSEWIWATICLNLFNTMTTINERLYFNALNVEAIT